MIAQIPRYQNADDGAAFRLALHRGYLVCPSGHRVKVGDDWLKRCRSRGEPCVIVKPDRVGKPRRPGRQIQLYTPFPLTGASRAAVERVIRSAGDRAGWTEGGGYFSAGGVPQEDAERIALCLLFLATLPGRGQEEECP
jgi:hypothetical protein